MWEKIIDLDVNGTIIGAPWNSFMSNYIKHGTPTPIEISNMTKYPYSKSWGSPGLAWAANVDALYAVGGVLDFCILGSGDWYMAQALIGALGDHTKMRDTKANMPFYRKILRWQALAERWIKKDVGFVPGTVLHDFHGSKKFRRYIDRDEILLRNKFDPDTDIKPDSQGLYQLETWEPRQIKLRDQIRAYFASRNEDSIDT
jgi:hypothetical protein